MAMDVVFMRQDPPFNMEYITATYMLETIDRQTLVVNHPVSVRNAPEKIFPFAFREYMPATVVTEDIDAVKAFLEDHREIIIKPLYMYGGTGVYYIKTVEELEEKFAELLGDYQAPIVAQQFIPEVKDGDKRILLIDGEVQGAFLRIPEEGNIRANLMAGGSLQPTELTEYEQKLCNEMGPILKESGFMICGIDIIGDYLTEINITSPIGFLELNKLYGKNIAATLWDKVESKLDV
jgi:glutathione synthase